MTALSAPASRAPTPTFVAAAVSPHASSGANAPAASATLKVALVGMRLPSPRSRAVAIGFGQTILLAGGLTKSGGTTGSILRLDLASGHATLTGRLASPVHDAGAALLGHFGLVVGGGRFGAGAVVQRVDQAGASRIVGHLPAARADLTATAVGRTVVVAGGGTPTRDDRRVLTTVDGVHFRSVGTLSVGVRYPAAVTLSGRLYLIGGSALSGDVATIQVIDPVAGTVRTLGRLPYALSHASAFVIGSQIVIAGGRRAGRPQNALWSLDPATGLVTAAGRLPYAVSDAASVVVGGIGYLIGGEAAAGRLSSIVALSPG